MVSLAWWLLTSWLAAGTLDLATEQARGAAELRDIERSFPARARDDSERALERLIDRWPETEAASRSRLWLGSLALFATRDASRFDRAALWFEAATRHPLPADLATLAERGRGDADAGRGRWRAAASHYDAALRTSTGLIAIELEAKRDAALREVHRDRLARIAWALVAAVGLWLAVGLFSAGRAQLRWPAEGTFLVPLYAVLVAVAWHHDAGVGRAVGAVTFTSLLLVGLTFAPASARTRRRLLVDALLSLVATVAMLYIALHRAGLLDLLWARLTHANA